MNLQVSLNKILRKGSLDSELEFQRASIIDRRLRLLVQDDPELTNTRKQLRSILKAYEDQYWVNAEITDQQVVESNIASQIAEQENIFNLNRKKIIRTKLKEIGITQKELGIILGHTSETYMSELINGIDPFTLNDLIIIHKVLHIGVELLIPTTLSTQIISKVISAVSKLNNPKLKLEVEDLVEA